MTVDETPEITSQLLKTFYKNVIYVLRYANVRKNACLTENEFLQNEKGMTNNREFILRGL
jgi:hypothetical protein